MLPLLLRCLRYLSLHFLYFQPTLALPASQGLALSNSTAPSHAPVFPLENYLRNPTDFTAVLLIIGGDIVQKALAQLSGSSPYGAPIAFSFGWVAYSFNALASVVGDGRLIPEPEFPAFVINSASGYARQNGTWVLARILRDIERGVPHAQGGLCVTIFDAVGKGGVPTRDWVWYIGLVIIPVQFGIALVPWVCSDNWIIFLLTASGTLLAWMASLLPQWTAEKWRSCRRRQATYSLTRGNGHRHVFVIRNQGDEGLNLEDLAASHAFVSKEEEWWAKVFLSLLAMAWLVFLLCVGSIKVDVWYLLAIGYVELETRSLLSNLTITRTLGMLQNIVVAGATRSPQAHGLDLKRHDLVEGKSVMKVLQEVDHRYPGVGLSLLRTYFPGALREEEEQYWASRKNGLHMRKSKPDTLKCTPPSELVI
jgi:hypothetical protein